MKFTIGHSELNDLSSILSKYSKQAGDGYGYLQINAKNGVATFKTSNESETVVTEYKVDKCYIGTVIVEADKFLKLAKTFYDLVVIEAKENLLELKSKGSKYRLPILNDVAFFCLQPLESDPLEINFSDNLQRIRHTIDNSGFSNIKQFYWFNDKYIVTTNGYTISELELDESTGIVALVSPSSFKDITNKIEVRANRTQIDMKFGTVYLMSRLNEGKIPDHRVLIPNYDNYLTVDRKLMILSLNRLSLLSSGDNYVKMFNDENNLVITTESDSGKAEEVIDCELNSKIDFKIGLNLDYIVQSFGQIKGNKIQIYFDKSEKPIVIKSPEKPELTFLIMPKVR